MELYNYLLLKIRVIDGDSLESTLDRGMKDSSVKVIRMFGINAPESRTKDLVEKKKGLKSKKWLINRIAAAQKAKLPIIVKSHKKITGKYGRVLGTVIIDGVDVNQEMVKLGLAVPYMGGKRK